MRSYAEQRVAKAAQAAILRSQDPTRHKVFVSYHADDADEVIKFIDSFGHVFIPKTVGVSADDPWVDSSDTDYVMDKIREDYLTDSTVTVVMVGKCTWARKFIDWEVYSTLRNDKNNRRSGLLAITLPSIANSSGKKLPARADDNVIRDTNNSDIGYARWWKYPTSDASLRGWIDDAFKARTQRAHLINNARARKLSNSACS